MKKTVHYIGLDVHKESIAVAIAVNKGELRRYGVIGGKLADIDKLVKKLQGDGVELRFCYEAGPCGYVIYRHLAKRGLSCAVVAPSLIPRKASDRVKTDRRDALSLARLYRAGELTPIHVPDLADEAVRDVVRLRLCAIKDQRRARQRLKMFLLRLGFVYPGKSSWTEAHRRYLAKLKMPTPAQQIVFEEYQQAVATEAQRVERLTKVLLEQLDGWRWKSVAQALMCLRGIQALNAMTLLAELGDLSRFANPRQLMAYLGLVPSEDTSGPRRWQGSITKSGNEAARRALVEAAHQYRLPARLSPTLLKRQDKQSQSVRAIAWKAQLRLCSRYRKLLGKGKKPQVVVTSLARELGGFVWAIACTAMGKPPPSKTAPPPAPKPSTTKTYRLDPTRQYQPRSANKKRPTPTSLG